jgi:tartrate dehydratase alpha subunit/fumarate hydratase class I-like protein
MRRLPPNPPRLGPASRTLEFVGNIVIRAGSLHGKVPCPPIRIKLGVGRLCQRLMHATPSCGDAAR